MFGTSAGTFALHVGAMLQQPFAFVGLQTLGLINGDPRRAPTFCRCSVCLRRRTPEQSPDRVFRLLAIGLRFSKIHFQRQTARAANHSTLPCARPALSSSAVKFAAKDSAKLAVLLVAALQCRFPPEKFSDMAASYLSFFVAIPGSRGLLLLKHNKPCHCFGQGANTTQNAALTFGDGDSFTRIQQVEAMGGFQNRCLVGRGSGSGVFPAPAAAGFFSHTALKAGEQEVDVGVFGR